MCRLLSATLPSAMWPCFFCEKRKGGGRGVMLLTSMLPIVHHCCLPCRRQRRGPCFLCEKRREGGLSCCSPGRSSHVSIRRCSPSFMSCNGSSLSSFVCCCLPHCRWRRGPCFLCEQMRGEGSHLAHLSVVRHRFLLFVIVMCCRCSSVVGCDVACFLCE